jgi:dolichyl-phosphate beta-glucosyltransferase
VSSTVPQIFLSVVIPAYLEEKNISQTLHALKEYFDRKPYRVEYLVVDDGSTDATSTVAESSGARVVRFDTNRGKGAAVRAGMLEAKGEYILFTDADHPYEIDSIDACIEKLRGGFDLVIGSRNLPGSDRGRERMKRRIISKVGNMVARIFILPGISDTQAGFKCFKRNAARAIFSRTLIDGWGFDIEALYLARMLGYKTAEVPIRLIPRAIKPSRIQSPTRTAMSVLGSILTVHWNRISGRYAVKKVSK